MRPCRTSLATVGSQMNSFRHKYYQHSATAQAAGSTAPVPTQSQITHRQGIWLVVQCKNTIWPLLNRTRGVVQKVLSRRSVDCIRAITHGHTKRANGISPYLRVEEGGPSAPTSPPWSLWSLFFASSETVSVMAISLCRFQLVWQVRHIKRACSCE